MTMLDENIAAGQGIGPALAEFTRLISVELSAPASELPGFPEVALRVRQALARDDISIEEIVRIVSAEPSLAVRLLQLANSAALNSAGQRVTTLRTAVARVGFNLARSATIAFAMSQMRRGEAWRDLAARFRQIWELSARHAAVSFAVARYCERDDADQALLAAMLQAVGRLFVLRRVSRFPILLADAAIYSEIEQVWQGRAVRSVLVRWELPQEVLEAASADPADSRAEGGATLSDVVNAGRHLMGVLDIASLTEAPFLRSAAFQRLGLDDLGAAQVLADSAVEMASLRAALAD
jgi:HD-like signal output (HDOD) protein